MAHYLAERIEALEALQGKERTLAEIQIADQILQLWEHRHGAVFRVNPIAVTESVERAIARLDPQGYRPWNYYDVFDGVPGPSETEVGANAVLQVALKLDRTMADLMRSLVIHASLNSRLVEAEWLHVARAAGADPLAYIRKLMDTTEPVENDMTQIETEWANVLEKKKIAIELFLLLVDDASADEA